MHPAVKVLVTPMSDIILCECTIQASVTGHVVSDEKEDYLLASGER